MKTICINTNDDDKDIAMLLIDDILNKKDIEHEIFINE